MYKLSMLDRDLDANRVSLLISGWLRLVYRYHIGMGPGEEAPAAGEIRIDGRDQVREQERERVIRR
jgi:hypothetical protein